MSPRAVTRIALAALLAVTLLVSGGSRASVLFRCSLSGGLFASCCCATDDRPEPVEDSGAHGCCHDGDEAPAPVGPLAQRRCCDEVHVAAARVVSEPTPHRAPALAPLLAVVREAPPLDLSRWTATSASVNGSARPATGPPSSVLTRSYRC